MAINNTDAISAAFAALADPTPRASLARLATGEADVTELMQPFALSQPTISKHLNVLERAGLIARGRDAQRRPRTRVALPLKGVADWVDPYRRFWEEQLDGLDGYLKRTQPKQKTPARKSDRTIVITRTFDAPRAVVVDAWTSPEHVTHSWAPGALGSPPVPCTMSITESVQLQSPLTHTSVQRQSQLRFHDFSAPC